MPRIQGVEYRTEAPGPGRSPTAQPSARYSGEGQGLQQLGGTLNEFGARLQEIENSKRNSEEVIQRIQDLNSFRLKTEQEWTRLVREKDIAKREVFSEYQTFLNEAAAETLRNHPGREESRMLLAQMVEEDRGKKTLSAYNQGTQAQQKALGDYAEGVIGRLSANAGDAPATISVQFAELDKELGQLAPALTPEQEEAYRKTGRSQIVVRAATSYLDTGNFMAANRVLSTPGISELMNPDTLRQLKSQVTVQSLRSLKVAETQASKVREMEAILGRPLTEAEKLRHLKIAPPESSSSRQSLAEWVTEVESVTGEPVTAEMVRRKAGAGTSPQGEVFERQISAMGDLADAVEAGVASEQDIKNFKNAWAVANKVQVYVDELGRRVQVKRPIPDYIQRAGNAIGLSVESSSAGDNSAEVSQTPSQDQDIPWNETILGMNQAGTLTGPIATGMNLIGKDPIIGGPLTGGGGDYTRNQTRVKLYTKDLIRAFALNSKYPVTEMENIKSDLELLANVVDSQEAYQQRALGLRDVLIKRAADASKTAVAAVGAEERVHARNVFNAIQEFLPLLGNPIEVKSRSEYDSLVSSGKLRPGDPVITPVGIKKVPGGR